MILLEFEHKEEMIEAARALKKRGVKLVDAFSPYPVEELWKLLDTKPEWVSRAVFLGTLTGAALGFLLQSYSAVFDYPMNVRGMPLFSWPAFLPVTFEMGVLFGSFAGFFATLIVCRLPRLHHPVFEVPAFARASTDRFFLLLDCDELSETEGGIPHEVG